MKSVIKKILLLMAVMVALGPVLFFAERPLLTSPEVHNAVCITVIASVFFCYSSVSLLVQKYFLEHSPKVLTSFYLGEKMFRMILGVAAILLYKYVSGKEMMAFAISLLVFFNVSVIFSTICSIKAEKQNNQ